MTRFIPSHTLLSFTILLTSFLFSISYFSCSNQSASTTVILVRHADRPGSDDDLSEAGLQRAEKLIATLKDAEISAIYTTDYQRTRKTAQPIASNRGLTPIIYNPNNLTGLKDLILKKHTGETVLVVGHSNTVPETILAFGEQPPHNLIPHDEYDHLYFLTLTDGAPSKLLFQRYGN